MLYPLVSASGCATFPTDVDQPAPSSARVTSRRIVDSAAAETQLPLTVLPTLVGTRRFAESPDVFELWTISYLLSGAVCSCTSSGVPSLPGSIVRSLLVCWAHTRTARLSDIVRRTVAPMRHPFYMRLNVDRESAHRSSLPNRQWRGRLQQCVRRLTQSAHDDEFEASPLLQFTFQQMPTLSTYQSMVFE